MRKLGYSFIFVLLISGMAFPAGNPKHKLDISFTQYHNYEQLSEILHKMADVYSNFIKLESIGKSYTRRDIWAVTINNKATGPEQNKAAMFIQANIHGNEVQGSEVCLYTIWYLMENYGKIDKITELVDQRVFYILPTVNPDGRAFWFDEPNTSHSSRGGQVPTDNDGDWLFDEDGFDDLDGDGEILEMRKRDPEGRFKTHPDDPRLMISAKDDEPGEFIYLGSEGIDNDGDGEINEDGPGGYDPNRNWPSEWQPRYIQYGAGDFPLSLPESQAVADFILARPNIAGVQGFHNAGGMILRGPGTGDLGDYSPEDVQVYEYLGKKGEKILPDYRYMVLYKDMYSVYGGFITWTFEDLGIFSFTNELFSIAQYYSQKFDEKSSWYERFIISDEALIQFSDLVQFGDLFVEWKPYNHPTYGEIEIGGWKKYSKRVDPTFILPETCHRNCAFTMFHAAQLPWPGIEEIEAIKIDDQLYRVRAGFTNMRLIPTVSAQAAIHHLHRADLVTIEGKQADIISAGWLTDKFNSTVEPVKGNPARVVMADGVHFGEIKRVEWIVRGKGQVQIVLDCLKGGKVRKVVELK